MVSLRLNTNTKTFTPSEPPSANPLHKEQAITNTLFVQHGQLEIGQVNRFIIRINRANLNHDLIQKDEIGSFLWLRVRNREMNLFRPIYLTGPFSFYIDITPANYHLTKRFSEPIQYNADIKPGQSFKGKLYLTGGSQVDESDVYSWTVDIVSQLALTTHFIINYRFAIGYEYKLLKKVAATEEIEVGDTVHVKKLNTKDLWTRPPRFPEKPVHLVIVTHGIFSNVGADMLYLKDQIEEMCETNENANIIVRGYDGNVGKSEKGIRYLGKRVAYFLLEFYDKSQYKIESISFIGHSLGGDVQAFAISHITKLRPEFFKTNVIPLNFIALASPFLGVLTEFPKAFSLALDVGVLGSTGRDLTLSHKFPSLTIKKNSLIEHTEEKDRRSITSKPILEQIIRSTTHHSFESFLNRTLYANAINDGIVPLRTAALLYLDWKGLGAAEYIKRAIQEEKKPQPINDDTSLVRQGTVTEIPEDDPLVYETAKLEDQKVKEVKEHKEEKENDQPVATETSSSGFVLKKAGSTFFSQISPENLGKRHRVQRFLRTQTITSSSTGDSSPDEQSSSTPELERSMLKTQISNYESVNIPPVASTFLSAASVMTAPLPSPVYLIDPHSREPTIFHDKIYTFDDLPPSHYSKDQNPFHDSSKIKHFITGNKKAVQERIARQWHWNMPWRKVLVTLTPDAHNNIIVRRKYVSAWGWGVIAHLVDTHFSEEAIAAQNRFVGEVQKKREEQAATHILKDGK